MPVMDGATFRIEQLRDAALRTIPVVVLSGSGAVGRMRNVAAVGCVFTARLSGTPRS
jgi:CheY-like chemotaxis protein